MLIMPAILFIISYQATAGDNFFDTCAHSFSDFFWTIKRFHFSPFSSEWRIFSENAILVRTSNNSRFDGIALIEREMNSENRGSEIV